jgi:hypothetical protein
VPPADAESNSSRPPTRGLGIGSGFVTDFATDSPLTVVAFGGLTNEGEEPVFEFFRFLNDFDVRKVFLRDDEQAWYQLGARGMGSTLDEVQTALLDLLGPVGCRHAVFTGGSMGGYAAMYFGARLGAGEVQAFAPQTFLDRLRRRYYKDFRWQRAINHMKAGLNGRPSHLDLRRPLRRAARHRAVPIHIHVADYGPDLIHAARVRRVPGVRVHRCPEISDHRIARALNEDGRLTTIFDDALARVS